MKGQATFEDFRGAFLPNALREAQILHLLSGAIRAPSTHNSQPWQFRLTEEGLEVLRDTGVSLPNSDKEGQYAHISIGFLLHHIETLGRYLGMSPVIEVRIEGNSIAHAHLKHSMSLNEEYEPFAKAIFARRNRRGNFLPTPLPSELLDDFRTTPVMPKGLPFIPPAIITEASRKHRIGELTLETMVRLYGLPPFRREMSGWVVPSNSSRATGIPGYSLNQPLLLSLVLPSIIRRFNIGKLPGKLSAAAIASAPALFGFGAKSDPSAWLSIGYESSRIILSLVSRGFDASVYVATAELPEIREEAMNLFGLSEQLRFIFAAGKLEGSADWQTPRVDIWNKILPS